MFNGKMILILGAVLAANINLSHAGGVEGGNGGGAHVCHSNTRQQSAETYDLFEARKLRKLVILPTNPNETKEQIIDRVLQKIESTQPAFAEQMRTVLTLLNQPGYVTDASDIELFEVKNANLLFVGKGCKYKQLVNWLDPGQITPGSKNLVLRDEQFYAKDLDPQSQAALDIHEAAYKVARDFDPKFIETYGVAPVRQFVGEAFSTSAIVARISRIDDGSVAGVAGVYFLRSSPKNNLLYYKLARAAGKHDCDPANITIRLKNIGKSVTDVISVESSQKIKGESVLRSAELKQNQEIVFKGNELAISLIEKAPVMDCRYRVEFSGCGSEYLSFEGMPPYSSSMFIILY